MYLDDHDQLVMQLVSKFGHMDAKQLQELAFYDKQSDNPFYRSINKLVKLGFLKRLEWTIRSERGGNGVGIYQLGRRGRDRYTHRATPRLEVLNHTLLVTDCYVVLVRLERAGKLAIISWSTEPHNHMVIKGDAREWRLTPDLTAEIARPGESRSLHLFIEADFDSEGPKQITEKLVRYWGAREAADEGQLPDKWVTLFVAVNERRAQELKALVERGSQEQQAIFRVRTIANLEDALSG